LRECVAIRPRAKGLPATLERLEASDHHLDALVSAVVGRAVELGLTLPIPAECVEAASTEGWIHLPARQPLSAFEPFS
jgi:hypothetical protein